MTMPPPTRIDALGPERRLRGLTDPLLEHAEDPTLQRIVREAAASVGAPIALVSLVLDNIQFFRAQIGLPDDLARAAATARDVSFCQFAVRDDALFEVEDAAGRSDLPQTLVETHGIRAYLGAPIHLDGQPLGSLCVIDTRPRTFTAEQRAQLVALAAEVDARIAEWCPQAAPAARVDPTVPVIAEMRSRLNVLACARDELRITRTELFADQRSGHYDGRAFGPFSQSRRMRSTLLQLDAVLDMLDRAGSGLAADLAVLEATLDRGCATAEVPRVVELAANACRLTGELVGDIRWSTGAVSQTVARPAANAALLVAAAVDLIARETPRSHRSGLQVTVAEAPGWISFAIAGAPLADRTLKAVWQSLEESPLDTAGVRCAMADGRLHLSLPAVPR